jgi:hypothetical protein
MSFLSIRTPFLSTSSRRVGLALPLEFVVGRASPTLREASVGSALRTVRPIDVSMAHGPQSGPYKIRSTPKWEGAR